MKEREREEEEARLRKEGLVNKLGKGERLMLEVLCGWKFIQFFRLGEKKVKGRVRCCS
jgi:hypothetical protein